MKMRFWNFQITESRITNVINMHLTIVTIFKNIYKLIILLNLVNVDII
jgi:hypothetical protein